MPMTANGFGHIDRRRRGVNSRQVSLRLQESWYVIHGSGVPRDRIEFAVGEFLWYAERHAGARGDLHSRASLRSTRARRGGTDAP